MNATRRPALFLDRDGTLIEECDYLGDPARVRLLPGVLEALSEACAAGMALVLVSNQSGIARGYFGEQDLARVHAELERQLAQGGVRLDLALYCPHHPEAELPAWRKPCTCRKPAPGLLFDAARSLSLELGASWVIGDSLRDLEAGARAGVPGQVLVLTGKGRAELAQGARPARVAPDLVSAVREHVLPELRARVQGR